MELTTIILLQQQHLPHISNCRRRNSSNLLITPTRKRTTTATAKHERKSTIKMMMMIPFPINPPTSSSSSFVVAKAASGVPPPLDLTEDNVRQVLADARVELSQLFDTSVGMTGVAELGELDGPFVRISLRGRFWHKRSTVLARLANYLKQRIPEILEVDVEDEKQLDDSPANF